ncbi:TonB-dependent receptor [Sphingomonas bacterium]|uniref:TonB-dependent receptor n=1 Tax=Sphingomonas bacterium TaxID=1895847 RepID=UPI0020C6F785|nr:TonB-dependent receptor [Sphingomonas bacterium]
MRRSSYKATIFASSAVVATAFSGPAMAQEQQAGTLEDIVVTAQKVDTRLQKTPISITALTDDTLQKANIRTVLDLDKQVPGLTVTDAGPFPLNITIRGVGFDGLQNNSAQPGVAFVQNGVYVASPISLTATFLDPGQVEVLRGPQGTVNGQNADGGAINITTGAPVLGKFRANGEASYGSYDYVRLRGVANIPVGDTLAIRAAFQHEGHGGWFTAPNQLNKKVGDLDSWSGRINALWAPTEKLSFGLWAEFFDNNTAGLGIKNIFDTIPGVRTTSNDYPNPQTVRSRIVAGTIKYDLDFAQLKSITSYQKVFTNAINSGDSVDRRQALILYGYKDEEPIYLRQNRSITQEINLSHSGGALDWIVGGFFLNTKGGEKYYETQQNSAVRINYTPLFDPTPAQISVLFAQGLAFVSESQSRRTSIAGYGQATYHLSDALRITGGARFSRDKYSADTEAFYNPPLHLVSQFKKITGKASVEYDLSRTSTVYGSFSTGVKPGGTNLNTQSTIVPKSFRHEFLRAYELGSKNELFGRKLRLNLSAFYNDYRNLQAPSEDPLPYQGGVTNVPKSHVYGIEGEVSIILPAGFRIDANATAMRSKVDSSFLAIDPYTAQLVNRNTGGPFVGNNLVERAKLFVDLRGNELGRVPHFSAAGSISKSSIIGDAGTLDLFLQANYRSAYEFRIFNNPITDRVPNQFLLNFNARFQPANQVWYAELQVTNVTASTDVASRYAENFGVGGVFDSLVPPRQVIGRVGFKF